MANFRGLEGASWSCLKRFGYVVIDDVMSGGVACLRGEIEALSGAGRLVPNYTHLLRQGQRQLMIKSNILEAEIALEVSNSAGRDIPNLKALYEDPSFATLASQMLPGNDWVQRTMKVQRNLGESACFPLHYDTNGADGRFLTAILYLNEKWTPEDGGMLQLYPFPYKPVEIAPIAGRLVLFSSRDLLHRVLPSRQSRECLTIWLYKNMPIGPPQYAPGPPVDPTAEEWVQTLQRLMTAPLRRHLSKWFYRKEWAQSIQESHSSSIECDNAVEQHWADVQVIETALGSVLHRNNLRSSLLHDLQCYLPLSCEDTRFPVSYFEV
jgi:hypothetical protein